MHAETHVSVYSIPLYIYLSWSHGMACSTGQIHMAWSHGIAVHSLRCIHVCIFRSLYPTYLSVYPGIPCIHGCLCLCIQCIRVCIRQCISASIYRSPITEFILNAFDDVSVQYASSPLVASRSLCCSDGQVFERRISPAATHAPCREGCTFPRCCLPAVFARMRGSSTAFRF